MTSSTTSKKEKKMVQQVVLMLCFLLWSCICLGIHGSGGKLDWRMPIAGGIAGGLSNAIIHPIDTVKTVLQTDKSLHNSFREVLNKLKNDGIMKIYAGFVPAVFGSMPSSALYFGTYEFLKEKMQSFNFSGPIVYATAAGGGNLASSILFVPKEVLKQQLQAYRTGSLKWTENSTITATNVLRKMVRNNGIKGLYPSYKATLARNIPSAMIRFGVYEEMKYRFRNQIKGDQEALGLLIVGGFASAVSASVTTPFDVIKTRLSTGLLPVGSPIFLSMASIARKEGFGALYSGMGERTLWSALYGGIGLACYELTKQALNIAGNKDKESKLPSKRYLPAFETNVKK